MFTKSGHPLGKLLLLSLLIFTFTSCGEEELEKYLKEIKTIEIHFANIPILKKTKEKNLQECSDLRDLIRIVGTTLVNDVKEDIKNDSLDLDAALKKKVRYRTRRPDRSKNELSCILRYNGRSFKPYTISFPKRYSLIGKLACKKVAESTESFLKTIFYDLDMLLNKFDDLTLSLIEKIEGFYKEKYIPFDLKPSSKTHRTCNVFRIRPNY